LISFDHQHILTTCQTRQMPWRLRAKAALIRVTIPLFVSGQRETLVSSFYHPPLHPRARNATQVGVMLRAELVNAKPADDGFLLVYLRRFAQSKLLEALRSCERNVRVYGLGGQPRDGNIEYFEVHESRFMRDLVRCHAVISNAGNQLIGEAFHLGKPALALPESGNFEQAVNGHLVDCSGGGFARDPDRFGYADLREFLERIPELKGRLNSANFSGNLPALAVIERYLDRAAWALPTGTPKLAIGAGDSSGVRAAG
jgi:uncharacterized protein (TIGR00661 family)